MLWIAVLTASPALMPTMAQTVVAPQVLDRNHGTVFALSAAHRSCPVIMGAEMFKDVLFQS